MFIVSVRPSVCLKPKFGRLKTKFDDGMMQGPRSGSEAGPRSGPEKLSSAPRSTSSTYKLNTDMLHKIRYFL